MFGISIQISLKFLIPSLIDTYGLLLHLMPWCQAVIWAEYRQSGNHIIETNAHFSARTTAIAIIVSTNS